MSLLPFLQRVSSGDHLSAEEAHNAMSVLLEGAASESLIAAFLIALRMKGETSAELAGFARAMRERMIFVDAGDPLIDTCGTGGDGPNTFNVSTVAALVMAGAGTIAINRGSLAGRGTLDGRSAGRARDVAFIRGPRTRWT